MGEQGKLPSKRHFTPSSALTSIHLRAQKTVVSLPRMAKEVNISVSIYLVCYGWKGLRGLFMSPIEDIYFLRQQSCCLHWTA